MKIKSILLGLILFTSLVHTESEKQAFIGVNYQDLTDKSTVFAIPFRFAVPTGYVIVSDFKNNQRHVVVHKKDLERINANGGMIETEIMEYPFYYIEASIRYGFVNGKFTVEDKPGSERFRMTRLDTEKLPILAVEPNEGEKLGFKMLLIHPNYETWVSHLHYFESGKHAEFSAEFWRNITETILGRLNKQSVSTIPRGKIRPSFPDSAKFAHDIYRSEEYKPAPVPKSLPKLGASEAELASIMPNTSIRKRLSFLSPVIWRKGKKTIEFDKYVEYDVVQDYENNSRVGYWKFQVFLRNRIVAGFNLIHYSVGPSKDYEPDTKSRTKEAITGDERDLEKVYMAQRSLLFRKAHER